jgi:hypothetical protein
MVNPPKGRFKRLHAKPCLCYTEHTMKPHKPSTRMGAVALGRVRGEAIVALKKVFALRLGFAPEAHL